jgi:hypothetical protein
VDAAPRLEDGGVALPREASLEVPGTAPREHQVRVRVDQPRKGDGPARVVRLRGGGRVFTTIDSLFSNVGENPFPSNLLEGCFQSILISFY